MAALVLALAVQIGLALPNRDLRRVIAYLVSRGARDPGRNWRWLAHGVYLARHRLDDPVLALEIANHLAGVVDPKVPVWVRQLPAFALAEVGERQAARDLFAAILATDPNLAADEVAFMRAFIDGAGERGRPVGDS